MVGRIEGVIYFGTAEVASEIGISQQTLWRWRKDEKIPSGLRFRGRRILFTREESEQIRTFANRLEPVNTSFAGVKKPIKSRGGKD